MALCLELVEQNATACKLGATATATSTTGIPFWIAFLALVGLGGAIGFGSVYISGDKHEGNYGS